MCSMTCGQVRTFGAYTFPISKFHDTGGPILHVFSKYLFLLLNEYEHEPSCLSFPSFHLKARIPESVSELRGQPSLRRRPVTKRVPSTPRFVWAPLLTSRVPLKNWKKTRRSILVVLFFCHCHRHNRHNRHHHHKRYDKTTNKNIFHCFVCRNK